MENRRRREFLKASGIVLGGLIISSPLTTLAKQGTSTSSSPDESMSGMGMDFNKGKGRGFWTGYYQGDYGNYGFRNGYFQGTYSYGTGYFQGTYY